MKKQAKDLKKGDKIKILDKVWIIEFIEVSDSSKQGVSKTRLELSSNGEKMAIIRPSNYPFECI